MPAPPTVDDLLARIDKEPSGSPSPPTVESLLERTKPAEPQDPFHRFMHGFEAPLVGLDQLASQIEQHLPFVPEETAKSDLEAAQKEKQEFEKSAPSGFSWMEMFGNMANPANYLLGAGGKAAGLVGAMRQGALTAAGSEAVQPDTNVGHDYWLEKGVKTTGAAGLGAGVGLIAEPLVNAISGRSSQQVDKFIENNFMKGVSPRFPGTDYKTRYNKRMQNAIGAIVANKNDLRLLDAEGNPAAVDANGIPIGSIPQSLNQFQDAIDQTKGKIFKAYDAMAKQAGQQGASVDLSPAIQELVKIAGNPVIMAESPDAVKHATSKALRYAKTGTYSPSQAQEAIGYLNKSLEAYYKNPTYGEANRAGVDATIANILRKELDSNIEKATGPGYQHLKNLYGSLRTIENDVARKAFKQAEKSGGLIQGIGDFASAAEFINGIAHFNPATVAAGAGLKTFNVINKKLKDPNRAIRRLFKVAEKGPTRATPRQQKTMETLGRAAPVGPISAIDTLTEARPDE